MHLCKLYDDMSFLGKVGEFSYEDVEIVSLDLELEPTNIIEEVKEEVLNALKIDVPINIYSGEEVLSDDWKEQDA